MLLSIFTNLLLLLASSSSVFGNPPSKKELISMACITCRDNSGLEAVCTSYISDLVCDHQMIPEINYLYNQATTTRFLDDEKIDRNIECRSIVAKSMNHTDHIMHMYVEDLIENICSSVPLLLKKQQEDLIFSEAPTDAFLYPPSPDTLPVDPESPTYDADSPTESPIDSPPPSPPPPSPLTPSPSPPPPHNPVAHIPPTFPPPPTVYEWSVRFSAIIEEATTCDQTVDSDRKAAVETITGFFPDHITHGAFVCDLILFRRVLLEDPKWVVDLEQPSMNYSDALVKVNYSKMRIAITVYSLKNITFTEPRIYFNGEVYTYPPSPSSPPPLPPPHAHLDNTRSSRNLGVMLGIPLSIGPVVLAGMFGAMYHYFRKRRNTMTEKKTSFIEPIH